MTLSEDEYTDLIEEMLIAEYGEENVERQVYLEETGRYADFIVRAWPVDMAIEVENDFEAVFKGVGQAVLYAAHEPDMTPVIIRPPLENERDAPEAEMLSNEVAIRVFDPEEWG